MPTEQSELGSGCVGVVVVGRASPGLGRLQRGWLIVQDGSRDRGGWLEGTRGYHVKIESGVKT